MIQALIDIQKRHGWRDERMAAELGVHRVTWSNIRNGVYRHSTDTFAVRAARRFPELLGHLVTHAQSGNGHESA
jgi:hypothetical protein